MAGQAWFEATVRCRLTSILTGTCYWAEMLQCPPPVTAGLLAVRAGTPVTCGLLPCHSCRGLEAPDQAASCTCQPSSCRPDPASRSALEYGRMLQGPMAALQEAAEDALPASR